MHVFEYLLRDFMNTEKHARRNSVVFIHDCMPLRMDMAARRPIAGRGWAGDVWKIVPVLRKYRPDLKFHLLDCPPTGLVMVTNLDPSSRALEQNYYDIIAESTEAPDDQRKLSDFARSEKLVATREMVATEDFAKFIWL